MQQICDVNKCNKKIKTVVNKYVEYCKPLQSYHCCNHSNNVRKYTIIEQAKAP